MSKDEEETKLIAQFVQKDFVPSDSSVVEGFPSQKKVILDVVERYHKIYLKPVALGRDFPHLKDSKFGPPIVIHSFGKLAHDYLQKEKYYLMLPLYHSKAGLALGYYYHRGINEKTKAEVFGIGQIIPYGFPDRPVYLLTPQMVKDLVQKKFGVPAPQEPIAMCYIPKNMGPVSERHWFWYLYFDKGFTYRERTIHSLFIVPFANVKDIDKVTLDELLMKESVYGPVSILDRFYTFADEDINFYDIEQKRNYLGYVALSRKKENTLYCPRLDFFLLE